MGNWMQLALVILEETNLDIYNIVQQAEQFYQAGNVEIQKSSPFSYCVLAPLQKSRNQLLQGKY